MPTKNYIQQEVMSAKQSSQDTVRRRYMKELADYTGRDTIMYASAFSSATSQAVPGSVLTISLIDIQGFMSALHGLKGDQLDLILQSPGGSLEAADQIVQYLRSKYEHIRAIVPQNAMSAATMIACACDEIVMGKHSAIGPIDPQLTFTANGQTVNTAAHALLDEFEQAKHEVTADANVAPLWVKKLESYPPGILSTCKTHISHSKSKVEEWLKKYMFKGDASNTASEIAEWLGSASEHKTHGRPITAPIAKEKGLKIMELEADQEFQEKVLSVYHATNTTFEITNCVKAVENHNGQGWYVNVEIKR